MNAVTDIFASAGLWAAVLRIATPLILGTLGALLCERSGVLNLGIEGIMTFGAMIGWLAVYNGADLWTGILVAGLSGGIFGLLHAGLTVTLGLSQHVSGLGVTLFASSFSYYVFRLLVPVAGAPPTIEPFQPINVPALSSLPFLGPALVTQTPPTYVAILLALVLGYVLFRTPLGLAIRMTGENPHAAEAQGINPMAIRFGSVIVGERADGHRRRLPDALRLQRLLPYHGAGAGLDLHSARRLRLLAAGPRPRRSAPVCTVRRLPAAPADAAERRRPLSDLPRRSPICCRSQRWRSWPVAPAFRRR